MTDIFQILFWPFLACLILTGIHAYLGLHVVSRGVIFVDLSLAQVAALGTVVAALAGFDLHDKEAYFFSLGFTLIGAALFSFTRSRKSQIPQEAVIGIVYAVCAAAAVLIMDRLPEGGEHLKHILVGNLLSVTAEDVVKIAVLYFLIGLIHWFLRDPFLMISLHPDEAHQKGYSVRMWDFLFYATFGLVVTSSVTIAGVLLVFSFLVVPPVAAMLFSKNLTTRLIIGWLVGTLVSTLGIMGSFWLDTPTGATVICTFGLVLIFLSLIRLFLKKTV